MTKSFQKSVGLLVTLSLVLLSSGCGKDTTSSGGVAQGIVGSTTPQPMLEGHWRIQREASAGNAPIFQDYARELVSIDSRMIRFVPVIGQHQNLDQIKEGFYERTSANGIRAKFFKNGLFWEENYTYSINGEYISLCRTDELSPGCKQGVRGAQSDRPTCVGSFTNPQRLALQVATSVNGRFPFYQIRRLARFELIRGLLPETCTPRIEIPYNEIDLGASEGSEPRFSMSVEAILAENDPSRPSAYRMGLVVQGRSSSGVSSGPLQSMVWGLDGRASFRTMYFDGARVDVEVSLVSIPF